MLIDDLLRADRRSASTKRASCTPDLFADFNGIPKGVDKTEFYQHDQNWSNRMILGDSLQVMASLAEREGLRGKVQCIYFDPPYGIKFNSNFQWSTTSRDVKDGKADHITREPEQVKAFRDTWRDGIHSYLTYLRDRLTVARDLLTDSGSIFVQIGDENVHRVRAVMDEVFGDDNFVAQITVQEDERLRQANRLQRLATTCSGMRKTSKRQNIGSSIDSKAVGWRRMRSNIPCCRSTGRSTRRCSNAKTKLVEIDACFDCVERLSRASDLGRRRIRCSRFDVSKASIYRPGKRTLED